MTAAQDRLAAPLTGYRCEDCGANQALAAHAVRVPSGCCARDAASSPKPRNDATRSGLRGRGSDDRTDATDHPWPQPADGAGQSAAQTGGRPSFVLLDLPPVHMCGCTSDAEEPRKEHDTR
jgi:hypothetical protein